MNCNTCRQELSLCLDGRLPSGRRASVMAHVAACGACTESWNGMQGAQRLTLQLPAIHVSENFREQLWQRIQAGEGTPEAVFHEPIAWRTKIRYTLTGALAAAAVLMVVTLVGRNGREDGFANRVDPQPRVEAVADQAPGRLAPRATPVDTNGGWPSGDWAQGGNQTALFGTTQRLTTDLVAVEAAKQLEQRHAAANGVLAGLTNGLVEPTVGVRQIRDNANEFRAIGELLLDMSDRRRLIFTDNQVDVDLRVAVNMLGQNRLMNASVDTVRSVVGEALRSPRLRDVSRRISIVPALDQGEEMDLLWHLNARRPDVFPKLFIMLGTIDRGSPDSMPLGGVFVMQDNCGPSWVAPRSTFLR